MALMRRAWECVFAVLFASAHAAPVDVVIRVPTGGGTDAVTKALAEARQARQKLPTGATGAIRVVFPAGEFPIFDTVELTPADSGTSAVPLVLEGAPSGASRWVGAWRLQDPRQGPGGRLEYALPASRRTPDFRVGGQFFVGDQRAVLARSPNLGSHWVVKAPASAGSKAAFVADKAAADVLGALSADERERAWLHVYQSWTTGRHRVRSAARDGGAVTITPEANWPFQQFGATQRYLLENAPSALDAAGEWLMTAGAVWYVPKSANDRGTTAYLPVNERLLVFKGDAARGRWVEHVHVRGLRFAYTYQPLLGGAAQGDWQGAVRVPAAIEMQGTRFVKLQDCEIAHTGGYAAWLRDAVQHVTIERCAMRDLGAGGVKVGEPDKPVPGRPATGFNRLLENVITGTGEVFPGGLGVWIGHSFGNVIQGNVIANTRYSGISVGWQWGYGAATSGDNTVRRNVLWNIGQGELADLGGIYTLGRAPGTVISGNYVRRVRGFPDYGAGAWGIYADEGSSDFAVRGNVVMEAQSGGFHLHYGRDLTVADNFLLGSGAPEVSWTDVRQSGPWSLENNVLLGKDDAALKIAGTLAGWVARGNLLPEGQQAGRGVCKEGCQSRPGLRLIGGESDVAALELQGLPPERNAVFREVLSQAQARVEAVRRDLPGVMPTAGARELRFAPQPQVPGVRLDFADMPLATQPAPLRYSPSGRPDLAQVAMAEPGRGRHCLRLTDGVPGLASFDPHVFLDYKASAGTVTVVFDVWVDELTRLVHEWRDGSEPFRTGPSLTLRGDGLEVGGRTLLSWRPRAWYKVAVSARTGGGPARWELTVTMPDGQVRRWRDLPTVSDRWDRLAWMGWVSSTEQASRTCMAGLAVSTGPE
jgi:hypothetical protein